MSSCPPMIFLDGDYLGALAAARHLGAQGVPCYLVSPQGRSILSSSKFVHHLPTSAQQPEALCQVLLELPSSFDGAVLYPASDDSAYFLAKYGDDLRRRFRLSFPHADVIMALLDKERLYTACKDWQIPFPYTEFPTTANAAKGWQGDLPALIKPKTQIYINVQKKGEIVTDGGALPAVYEDYVQALSYHHGLAKDRPKLLRPMIQQFHKEAQTDTISVSGYYHPDQTARVMLFTQKVLQKPKNIGIGLCFKAIPVIDDLADQVAQICRETGYFGVFEAEFIHIRDLDGKDRYLLMDFNPRLYSQLQFDIQRGSLLPEFYYYAALEDHGKQRALYGQHDGRVQSARKDRYSSYWYLRFTYLTQLIAGKVSLTEMKDVLEEYDLSHPKGVDACYLADDPRPYFFDQWRSYSKFLRHPRDTYRKFFKDVG